MYFNTLKKGTAIFLAATMAVSLSACRIGSQSGTDKDTDSAEQQTNGDDSQTAESNFPDDFGDMLYPIEALMVQSYAKELPYYNEESGEEDADSFWYSMAVLSSLMNSYVKDVALSTDDSFIYVSEDTVNMYAAALYDAYGKGNMEFPELGEDDTYATFDDEQEAYGLRRGDVGDLEPMITDCTSSGEDYVITAELRNSGSSKVLGIYEATITATSYEGEDNAFAYSVSDFRALSMEEEVSEEDTQEVSEKTESDTEATEVTEEETGESDAENISVDDALELAKEYYGSDAEYSYQGTVTVGDYEYYDFSVSGEDISATDVLVSESGQDVIGGNRNDDGSWSFDQ